MDSIAFSLPLLPGKVDVERAALGSCWVGPRREAFQDACRRAGITRETVWIQTGPVADLAVVYLQADDLPAALGLLATSAEPFDRWFRDHIRDVHGVSWDRRDLGTELVLDFDIDRT